MTTHIPLKERGTTGLIQYVVEGNDRMRGARMGKVRRIINARYKSWNAHVAFTKAVSVALHRKLSA